MKYPPTETIEKEDGKLRVTLEFPEQPESTDTARQEIKAILCLALREYVERTPCREQEPRPEKALDGTTRRNRKEVP